jgi:hypothetical protein
MDLLDRIKKDYNLGTDKVNQIPYPGETLAVIETIGISSLKIERFSWETGISYAIIGEK